MTVFYQSHHRLNDQGIFRYLLKQIGLIIIFSLISTSLCYARSELRTKSGSLLSTAEKAYGSQRWQEAKTAFTELSTITIHKNLAYLRLGQIALIDKQFNDAEDWLQRSIEIPPNSAE